MPDELLYDVDNHIWYQEMPDGNVKLGMTAVATAMAGQLVAYTPKKVGRSVEPGKSCATVESGKWVGPAKSAAGGSVAEVNEALSAKPALANEDPYGAGWLVILKANDWPAVKATLTPGAQVAAKYEAKMAADGFAGCAPECAT
jgi:glycine cleavage system H protein